MRNTVASEVMNTKNLHHGGANLAKTVFPKFWQGEQKREEGVREDEKAM